MFLIPVFLHLVLFFCYSIDTNDKKWRRDWRCILNKSGGGAKTNKNGLEFEKRTEMLNVLIQIGKVIKDKEIYNNDGTLYGIDLSKNSLYKFLEKMGVDWHERISKKLLPDNCIYCPEKNKVFIFEKKFQSSAGSVDEKLQTCGFKLRQFKKLFNGITDNVEYIYILNDWFLRREYDDVKEYINDSGCRYYFNQIPSTLF